MNDNDPQGGTAAVRENEISDFVSSIKKKKSSLHTIIMYVRERLIIHGKKLMAVSSPCCPRYSEPAPSRRASPTCRTLPVPGVRVPGSWL